MKIQYLLHIVNYILRFLNTLRTGDANLRHLRFLHYNCERDDANLPFNTRLVFTHLITQYINRT
jgi:hypothetical protein